jgi:hypothetical protein
MRTWTCSPDDRPTTEPRKCHTSPPRKEKAQDRQVMQDLAGWLAGRSWSEAKIPWSNIKTSQFFQTNGGIRRASREGSADHWYHRPRWLVSGGAFVGEGIHGTFRFVCFVSFRFLPHCLTAFGSLVNLCVEDPAVRQFCRSVLLSFLIS